MILNINIFIIPINNIIYKIIIILLLFLNCISNKYYTEFVNECVYGLLLNAFNIDGSIRVQPIHSSLY